jgi:thiol-disulfide isomerase/thioredoxin
MRKLFYLVTMVLALGSCGQPKEGYTLQVNLEGSEGKWVKLMNQQGREYIVFDSVLVEAGTPAMMSNTLEGVRTMYLTTEGAQGSIRLLMENASYEISGTLEKPVIVTDSKAQGDLNAYNDGLKPIAEKMAQVRNALIEQQQNGNTQQADSLRDIYYALYDQQDDYDSIYIALHADSYASVLALRGTFYMLDATGLEKALTTLDPALYPMEEYQFMEKKLQRMKAVDIGQPYIDFGLETPDGGMLKISDVHNGNVLLIDFWASWCGPCRRANPELVEIYQDYKDRGFDVLGVSLDRDSASWVKAIADDNLTWSQISDLKYWNSQGAELYGVSAIPHAVLIDREGIIAAKNLSGDKLREAIQELL